MYLLRTGLHLIALASISLRISLAALALRLANDALPLPPLQNLCPVRRLAPLHRRIQGQNIGLKRNIVNQRVMVPMRWVLSAISSIVLITVSSPPHPALPHYWQ